MQTQSDRIRFQRQRDELESGLTGLNEFWIRAEDWAERVADYVTAMAHRSLTWLEARPIVIRWGIV
ncbi:hypothetical protein ABTM50_20900, partial [Acinetobacter baumannii]